MDECIWLKNCTLGEENQVWSHESRVCDIWKLKGHEDSAVVAAEKTWRDARRQGGAAAIAAQAVVAAPCRPKIKWRGDGLFWGRRVYHSWGYIYHTLGLILEANSTRKSTRIKEELKRFEDQESIVLSSSSSFYILVIIMDCFDGYVGYFYNMLG